MAMILSNAAGEGEKPVKTLESIITIGNTLTEKPFLRKSVFKGCGALQSFDEFFTLTGRIAQNHSQVRPPRNFSVMTFMLVILCRRDK